MLKWKICYKDSLVSPSYLNSLGESLHGHSLGFLCFVDVLNVTSESIDLILSEIISHILGAKYDNDLVPLCSDVTGLI